MKLFRTVTSSGMCILLSIKTSWQLAGKKFPVVGWKEAAQVETLHIFKRKRGSCGVEIATPTLLNEERGSDRQRLLPGADDLR